MGSERRAGCSITWSTGAFGWLEATLFDPRGQIPVGIIPPMVVGIDATCDWAEDIWLCIWLNALPPMEETCDWIPEIWDWAWDAKEEGKELMAVGMICFVDSQGEEVLSTAGVTVGEAPVKGPATICWLWVWIDEMGAETADEIWEAAVLTALLMALIACETGATGLVGDCTLDATGTIGSVKGVACWFSVPLMGRSGLAWTSLRCISYKENTISGRNNKLFLKWHTK